MSTFNSTLSKPIVLTLRLAGNSAEANTRLAIGNFGRSEVMKEPYCEVSGGLTMSLPQANMKKLGGVPTSFTRDDLSKLEVVLKNARSIVGHLGGNLSCLNCRSLQATTFRAEFSIMSQDSNLQVLVRGQPPFIISFPAFTPPPDSIPPCILDNTHNNQVHATRSHRVRNTTWGTDESFYLAFALRNVLLAGELRCLQGDFKMFPVKHEQSSWMLDSALSERWSDLEKFLKLLCADIPALQSTNWHILLLLSFRDPEWPSQLSLGGPKWYDEMKKREGPFFMNQVDFFVRLFTSGNSQVSCFIDRTAKQQWFDYIPLLLQFSIPFWVFWGNTLPNKNEVHRDLVDLLPSDQSIQHANAEWEEFSRVNPQYRVPTPPQLAATKLGLEYHTVDIPLRPVASVPLFPPPIRWYEVSSAPAESSTTASLPPTASTTTASLPPWAKSEKLPGKNGPFVFEWEPAKTEEESYVHRHLVRILQTVSTSSDLPITQSTDLKICSMMRVQSHTRLKQTWLVTMMTLWLSSQSMKISSKSSRIALVWLKTTIFDLLVASPMKSHGCTEKMTSKFLPLCTAWCKNSSVLYSSIRSSLKTSSIWPIDMFPSKAHQYPSPSFMKNPVLVGSDRVLSQAIGSSKYLDDLKGLYSTYCSTLDSIFSSSHVHRAALMSFRRREQRWAYTIFQQWSNQRTKRTISLGYITWRKDRIVRQYIFRSGPNNPNSSCRDFIQVTGHLLSGEGTSIVADKWYSFLRYERGKLGTAKDLVNRTAYDFLFSSLGLISFLDSTHQHGYQTLWDDDLTSAVIAHSIILMVNDSCSKVLELEGMLNIVFCSMLLIEWKSELLPNWMLDLKGSIGIPLISNVFIKSHSWALLQWFQDLRLCWAIDAKDAVPVRLAKGRRRRRDYFVFAQEIGTQQAKRVLCTGYKRYLKDKTNPDGWKVCGQSKKTNHQFACYNDYTTISLLRNETFLINIAYV
ncbi:hypothetical protein C8Q75DRAFT_736487 [Abortiporus biennis]|nr:hypothetical protein C8Q75DRAFT_736487 [Abortiporus biennis]